MKPTLTSPKKGTKAKSPNEPVRSAYRALIDKASGTATRKRSTDEILSETRGGN